MTRNCPFFNHKFSGFSLPKLKKEETEKFWIYVVTFDPIQIQTTLAPQNDNQQLSFVKDSYIVAKKMTRIGCKMANSYRCDIYMRSDYSMTNLGC